jgi:hypothetical protein
MVVLPQLMMSRLLVDMPSDQMLLGVDDISRRGLLHAVGTILLDVQLLCDAYSVCVAWRDIGSLISIMMIRRS